MICLPMGKLWLAAMTRPRILKNKLHHFEGPGLELGFLLLSEL